MTHLRKLTLEELARRNYTEGTTRAYLRIIEDFARYFHRPPDQLGPVDLYPVRQAIQPCRFSGAQKHRRGCW